MDTKKYYVEYGFVDDLGVDHVDDLGKISGGLLYGEALDVVQLLQTTSVCFVEWTEIKEMP